MATYENYTDTQYPDIGAIPSHWKLSKISSQFEVICGATPNEHTENWEGNIPWIGPADMPSFGLISSGKRNISEKGYNSCGTSLVPKGTIILSTRAPIGKICIAANELCTNQGCKCLVSKVCNNSRFYAYYLSSILERLQEDGTGTTFKELSTAKLKDEPIILLEVAEQTAIADYLDDRVSRIDQVIAEAKASIEEYKSLKASVIYEAVTKSLDPTAEMKDSGVEWIGDIPINWSTTRFSKSNYIRARLGWKGLKAEEYVDSGFAFLSAFNIVNNKLVWTDLNFITEERYEESPEIKLAVGDIVLVKDGAGIGKCARVDELPCGESTVNSSLAVITSNDGLYFKYEYYFLLSSIFQNTISLLHNGMGVPHLTQESMKEIYLPLPPLAEQLKISAYLDSKCSSIDSLISEKESLIADLEAYKKSLIYEVVTGKRKVV